MTKYVIWCPDLGQAEASGLRIEATDPHSAACEWARRSDALDPFTAVASGNDRAVIVKRITTGYAVEMIVNGEMVPHYAARLRIVQGRADMAPK